ncbi:MAG: DNA recombination protein RmuC, partial [Rhodoferax sp.]
MAVNQEIVWLLLALGVLTLCLLVWVAMGLARARGNAVDAEQQRKDLQDLRAQLQAGHERLERELRREISESSQG